jgi:hypothetical protein
MPKNNKVSEIKDGPRKYVFGDPICDYTLERCETPDIPCSQCPKTEQDRYGPVSSW